MIHFSKRQLYLFLGFFLLLFPGFNISLSSVLMPGGIKHFCYLGAIAFIFLYGNSGLRFKWNVKILLLTLAALFFVYWRGAPSKTVDQLHLPYLVLFFSMFYLHTDDRWWGIFWKIIRIFCVFHLITGLLLRVMPGIHLKYVVPLFRLDSVSGTYRRLLKTIEQGFMTGLTNHYSTMGLYMALGVIAFAKPMLSSAKVKLQDWALFAIFVIGLIMTGKRGPFLFALIAVAFVYWLTNRPFTVKQYLRTYAIIAGLALAIPLAYRFVPQFRTLLGRFFNDADDINDVTTGRVEFFWMYALQLFLQSPLFGHGWRTFRVLNRMNFADLFNDVHNVYLQLAAETGIVGLTIFLALFIGAFAISCKALKQHKQFKIFSENQLFSLKISIAYQVYFMLIAFSENPLYDSAHYIPYFICCIIGYSAWYSAKKEVKKRKLVQQMSKYISLAEPDASHHQ